MLQVKCNGTVANYDTVLLDFSGNKVTVAIERENVFGMQFHPEKSKDDGLNVLSKVVGSYQ